MARSRFALAASFVLAGCASSHPPPPPPPALAPLPPPEKAADPDGIPNVVKRILAEERELADRCAELARGLPDPSGRRRAEREVEGLRSELEAIRIESPDTDELDAVVAQIVQLDRKLALLHEALTIAASRSALASE
jgi:hypothetical protein